MTMCLIFCVYIYPTGSGLHGLIFTGRVRVELVYFVHQCDSLLIFALSAFNLSWNRAVLFIA